MTSWSSRSTPSEIKPIPWLGDKVIKRLEEIITPEFKILEHGAGGSTIWFSNRCSKVVSFENNVMWKAAVIAKCSSNAYVYSDKSQTELPFQYFDLLLIDGEPVTDRVWWINHCSNFVKPGGYVILDNANRYEYQNERDYLHLLSVSYETIDCNSEHSRFLVTDICKLKE